MFAVRTSATNIVCIWDDDMKIQVNAKTKYPKYSCKGTLLVLDS
jgi:hypothetical protein